MLLYRSSSVRSFFTSQSYLPSIDYDGLGFPKSKMHHSTPLKLYHRDPIVLIEQCKMHFPTPLGSIPLRLCRPGRRVFCFPINSDIRSRLHMPFPSSPSINWFIGFVSVFFFCCVHSRAKCSFTRNVTIHQSSFFLPFLGLARMRQHVHVLKIDSNDDDDDDARWVRELRGVTWTKKRIKGAFSKTTL